MYVNYSVNTKISSYYGGLKMTPAINYFIRFVIGLLGALVISLGGSAYAALSPLVAVLDPIVNGLLTPLKMALDSDGSIYVADPRSGGVVLLDQYGKLKQVIKTTKPANVVALLDSTKNNIMNGKILVGQGNYVAVLDQDGKEVAKLGSGAGQFVNAAGIAVDSNGNIYVADAGAYNVKRFNSSGAYLNSFGSIGTGNGQFQLPGGIAVDLSSNQIAVVDTTRSNIQFFSSTGTYLKTIGGMSDYKRDSSGKVIYVNRSPVMIYGPTFSYPAAVTFEYANGVLSRMYVVDTFQGQIQALDPAATLDKQLLTYVGSYGDKSGNLLTPSDCVFDKINKRLLVANGLSNIVSFGIDGGQNPVFNGVPPALTVNQSVLTVNSASVVLNGTVDAGCTVAASVDTTAQMGTVNLPTASTWTVPVDSLTPGKNVVSITARDKYGLTTTKTATIQFVPPTAALSIGLYPSLTSQPSLVLSGTADAGAYVYVGNAASGVSGQAAVTDSGAWSYTLTLTEGSNRITVTASHGGASTAFKNIAVTLDTQVPLLAVSALPDGSATATQVQNISGTASDPNLASVTVNGDVVSVNSNGSFSSAVSLIKGANTIIVRAGDSAGNQSISTRTIKFNPDIPRITVKSPDDGSYTNTQELTVSGTVDSAVSMTVNGSVANLVPNPNGGLDWSAIVRLVPDSNTLIIAATNEVGTVGMDKRTITYYADKPVITINDPSRDIALNKSSLTIKGAVSDKVGIKGVKATLSVDGRQSDKDVTLVGGEFSLFADFTGEGTYTVTVTATNLANSISQAQRSVVYDSTPPALTIDPVQVPYPTALAGTVEAGASIEAKDDTTGCAFTVAVTGEKWNTDLSGCPYNPGTLVVKAVDSAQNSSVKGINPPVPDGDMDGDGKVTITDALAIIRLVVSNQKPTDQQLARGDIGPLLNGKINPKGRLDVVDAILILRKALGLPAWQ
jgi:hypothetical protein